MPLIDALRSGVDLANASNQGVVNAAQARYAFPMTEEELRRMRLANAYQTIINQYQPEKSRLGNESLGLANTYQSILNKYQPEKSRLENLKTETDINFTPLKYAIEAENARRNNSRFGGAYQYLKSVADLPAEQRSIFLGNEENYRQYMEMIQQLHDGIASGSQSGFSIITPELLKKVGLGPLTQDVVANTPSTGVVVSPAQTTPNGGLSATPPGLMPKQPQGAPAPSMQPPVVINNTMPPPMIPNSTAPQGGLNAPLSMPINTQGQPPMGGGMAAPMTPQGIQMAPQPAMATPMAVPQTFPPQTPPLTPAAASIAQQNAIPPQEGNAAANDAKNPSLTPQQKQLLGFQMTANKKAVGQYITNRALGGVTFEKVIWQNRDRFAPAFENAAKYAGLIGQGKLTLDKFRQEHPQEYADYMWITTDLIPNFGQNIRVMEGLASTDNQREALKEMYTSSLNWKSDPKMAIKNINRTIDLFQSQARAALETAQPVYPGALEKLYNINPDHRDYAGPARLNENSDISKISTAELLKMYRGGR